MKKEWLLAAELYFLVSLPGNDSKLLSCFTYSIIKTGLRLSAVTSLRRSDVTYSRCSRCAPSPSSCCLMSDSGFARATLPRLPHRREQVRGVCSKIPPAEVDYRHVFQHCVDICCPSLQSHMI